LIFFFVSGGQLSLLLYICTTPTTVAKQAVPLIVPFHRMSELVVVYNIKEPLINS